MDVFELLTTNQDPILAEKMSAYMKNHFPFLGIQKPMRTALTKSFLATKKKDEAIDWDFIWQCFSSPQREFHYLAMDYLTLIQRKLVRDDLSTLKKLLQTNSWWDSVDTISPVVGFLVQRDNLFMQMKKWIDDKDFWVRRASIIFQLKYKKDTDTSFLEQAILSNLGSKEFFIDKAIGWSLREYSKTDSKFVTDFLAKHSSKLANLSIREGSKHLNK